MKKLYRSGLFMFISILAILVFLPAAQAVDFGISGQINRAVNVANDGDNTEAYFVDNNTSNTRFRLVGSGEIAKDTTLGTVVEIAVSPNNSGDVSQDNQISDDFLDVRRADVRR